MNKPSTLAICSGAPSPQRLPARRAAFRPGVNHPVGRFDQFLITLNRDLTAAAFNQAQQHAQRAGGIRQAMPVVGSSSR